MDNWKDYNVYDYGCSHIGITSIISRPLIQLHLELILHPKTAIQHASQGIKFARRRVSQQERWHNVDMKNSINMIKDWSSKRAVLAVKAM